MSLLLHPAPKVPDLLESDDVRVDLRQHIGHAVEVEAPIGPDPAVDVVGNERQLHRLHVCALNRRE
jgi:hypothetical protein